MQKISGKNGNLVKIKNNTRPTIGLLYNDIFQEYEFLIWSNIVKLMEEYDINFIGIGGGALHSPDYYMSQKNKIFDLIDHNTIDGIIGLFGSIMNFIDKKKINDFTANISAIPTVSIGAEVEGIPAILIDNETSVLKLIDHLVKKHNTKKIAFIKGPVFNQESNIRFNAYKNALMKYNIPYDDKLVIDGNFEKSIGANAVKYLLDNNIEFDTILSANDLMSIGALNELQARNIKVPDEIKVCGFDNIKETIYSTPPLTTINQPYYDLADTAIKTILSLINNQKVNDKIFLPARLIIRESCGCEYPNEINSKLSLQTKNNFNINNDKIKIQKEKIYMIIDNKVKKNYLYINKRLNNKNWHKTLLDLIIDKIYRIPGTKLSEYLETIILETISKDIESVTWYDILSMFCQVLLENVYFSEYAAAINDIWLNSFSIIGLTTERYTKKIRHSNEDTDSILYILNRELAIIYNSNQIKQILYDTLSKLNIRSCYISLYKNKENNLDYSSLFYHYDINDESLNDNQDIEFQSKLLIPSGLKQRENRFAYMLMPLFFKNEQLGFSLFEIGTMYGKTYELLSIQISSAIKATMYIEELHNYTEELEQRVKQRTNELEKMNSQKTQFFINFAHEMKTPLTLIKNFIQRYINKKGLDNDLIIVKNNIDKLLRDMVNFLDAEKLNRSQIYYNNDQVIDFSRLLKNKLFLFKSISHKKNIKITENIDDNLFIKIDPYAGDRVINNLIDNSIKYTQTNGTIDVLLKKKGKYIIFQIKDNGIGISKEKINNIFKPFYQLSHSKRNIHGIGMGLFIVKKIIDNINGKITVKSTVNKGTAFKIIFDSYKVSSVDKISGSITYSKPIDSIINLKISKTDFDTKKYNILIIDDNEELLLLMHVSFKEKYNVFFAKNGIEALKIIKNIPIPDIIVSDIMMDEMDGHEFYSKLLTLPKYQDIPFIFLTGKTAYEDKIKGLKKGAIDYIHKPFMIEEISAKIESIIKNKEKQQEKNLVLIENKILNIIKQMENNTTDNLDRNIKYNEFYKEYGITNREKQVIELLLKGLFNKEISDTLNISIRTVEFHVHNIYKKLNVQNKIEFISFMKHYL